MSWRRELWFLRQPQGIPGPRLPEAGLWCFESSSRTVANEHLPLGHLLRWLPVGSGGGSALPGHHRAPSRAALVLRGAARFS